MLYGQSLSENRSARHTHCHLLFFLGQKFGMTRIVWHKEQTKNAVTNCDRTLDKEDPAISLAHNRVLSSRNEPRPSFVASNFDLCQSSGKKTTKRSRQWSCTVEETNSPSHFVSRIKPFHHQMTKCIIKILTLQDRQ